MKTLCASFQKAICRGDSPVLVWYPDDRRLHLAPVDVTGELRVPLSFDWLVQDVGVSVPLQRVDGCMNWTYRKEVTHGQ